jgi:signal-transduction protein with cAMP-binding, CBS, and nucleotidyltransferase domain
VVPRDGSQKTQRARDISKSGGFSASRRSGDDSVTNSTHPTRGVKFVFVAEIEDLANVPLFDSLGDDQLRELAKWFHVQNASEGVRLVGEGAPGYTFFIFVSGTAEVTRDGQALATLGPGDFFGEIAILGEGRRTATVTSTSPARLLVLFGTEFRQLEAAHPDIASNITDAMRKRVAPRISEPA